jgi:pimeloyl-ACP methyl ester carboxylesterase
MQSKTFERAEGIIAYDDYGGSGDVVLMLPGMGALRGEYRLLAPQVSEAGFRAVVADLRGHGDSSANWPVYDIPSVGRDILGLIEHLGSESAHLVGTSFSPGSIIWAAAEKPDAIRSMTLIGAFVRATPLTLIQRIALPLMMNGPWKVAAWITYYKTLYPTHKPDDFDTYLSALSKNLKEPGRFAAAKAFASAPKAPSEKNLDKVKKPTLVVMGTNDPDWPDPPAEAHFIAEKTGGQLALIEGAGHYPQMEMPDQTIPAILQFLQTYSEVGTV